MNMKKGNEESQGEAKSSQGGKTRVRRGGGERVIGDDSENRHMC